MKIIVPLIVAIFLSSLPTTSYGLDWAGKIAEAKRVASDPELRGKVIEVASSGVERVKTALRKRELPSRAKTRGSKYTTGRGRVAYIYDGDTYLIETSEQMIGVLIEQDLVGRKNVKSGNKFVLRLANIDTEESVHRDKNKNTEFGKKTSDIVKRLLSGKEVRYECYEKGYYKRAICSVVVPEGDLGIYLIEGGYSGYITRFGKHPTMHREYSEAANQF